MALSKLTYNSFNVTPSASKAVGFGSGADDLAASLSGGSLVFIKKLTASASGTLSFVDGTSDVVLDNTYKEYLFTFKDIHPSATGAGVNFSFNGSVDTGSNYNVTKTTTVFRTYHYEDDTTTTLGIDGTPCLAQDTGFQTLTTNNTNPADGSNAGILHLYDPSNTTFVKHFNCVTSQNTFNGENCMNNHIGGYFNNTSAVDAIQFKFASGNIDAGDICLYGLT